MTKAVSNRDICFAKAVLLLCEHGHFSLNFALHVNGTPKIYHGKLVELHMYEFYSFTVA